MCLPIFFGNVTSVDADYSKYLRSHPIMLLLFQFSYRCSQGVSARTYPFLHTPGFHPTMCVYNPILVTTFPERLSGTESWPRTPGAVGPSSFTQLCCYCVSIFIMTFHPNLNGMDPWPQYGAPCVRPFHPTRGVSKKMYCCWSKCCLLREKISVF